MRATRSNLFILAACMNMSLGCIVPPEEVGAVTDSESGTSAGSSDDDDGTSEVGSDTIPDTESSSDTDVESTGAQSVLCESDEDAGCCLDEDADGVPLGDDNATDVPNPTQADQDGDGIGDAIDLCPTIGGDPNNTADSDGDGLGNACDLCGGLLTQYNEPAAIASWPDYMLVRNIPSNLDTDGDGVGDVCDNCPTVPNCFGFGQEAPFDLTSSSVPDWAEAGCQDDSNQNGIGDACEGLMDEGAAGPAGFSDLDDFDQDGLSNLEDTCPRQPLPDAIACTPDTAEEDCGPARACVQGLCSHVDTDSDGVGDACDTCSYTPNPDQALEGAMQTQDADGDFVGLACEIGGADQCGDRRNPAPIAYHPVSVDGACCVQRLLRDEATGDLHRAEQCPSADSDPSECAPVLAPDPADPSRRIPVRLRQDCSDEDIAVSLCAALPAELEATPGIVTPPPGCEAALSSAVLTVRENMADPGTDLPKFWQSACRMPQLDADFDNLGDVCDLCTHAFDPANTSYVDQTGMLWPNDGAFCNGEYNVCD